MQLDAVLAATLGGLLWAFGVLGKRIGVEGASDDSKQIRATITIFLYSLTTTVTPFIDLLRMDRAAVAIPLQDEAWRAQVIFIVMCGLASGLGGVLGTLAFAWAAGANSSLISMVENGCYTLFGAVFISLYFLQNPHISMYVGGALIISGTVVANMGQSCGRTRTDQTKGDSDSTWPSIPCHFKNARLMLFFA
jgi:drug/metabolite transporter (DMT)-like permease